MWKANWAGLVVDDHAVVRKGLRLQANVENVSGQDHWPSSNN